MFPLVLMLAHPSRILGGAIRDMADTSIRINGIVLPISRGATVLELARRAGVEVPTLCYHPSLRPAGHCRVCVVEDLTSGKLLTACDTLAVGGMDVQTESPRALEARKRNLRLILSDHPETCVICEKSNACELRKLSSGYGIALLSGERTGHLHTIVDANPFIHRDLSKCIGCQICVRACREIQGAEAVEFTGLGTASRPLVAGDQVMSGSACELCGLCVSMCPVGALIEKPSAHTGAEEEKVRIICPYCGVGCSMYVRVRDNAVAGVSAGVPGSVNAMSLCVKGRFGLGFVSHPERLTVPLVREGDELVEATWDEALGRVVKGLKAAKKEHGADSIGVLASAKATNEENFLIQKFARAAVGTNNVDHCARL